MQKSALLRKKGSVARKIKPQNIVVGVTTENRQYFRHYFKYHTCGLNTAE
jgi:hypothetical protein